MIRRTCNSNEDTNIRWLVSKREEAALCILLKSQFTHNPVCLKFRRWLAICAQRDPVLLMLYLIQDFSFFDYGFIFAAAVVTCKWL